MKKKHQLKKERFVMIYHRILQSPSFTELGYSARALYLDMRMLLNGTNNGNISATLGTLRHRGWCSPTTLAKNLRELEAVGLIAKTRRTVGVENGSKLCNLYRFTDEPCHEVPAKHIAMMPATNDFMKFKSRAEVAAALRIAALPKKKRATEPGGTTPEAGGREAANDTELAEPAVVIL